MATTTQQLTDLTVVPTKEEKPNSQVPSDRTVNEEAKTGDEKENTKETNVGGDARAEEDATFKATLGPDVPGVDVIPDLESVQVVEDAIRPLDDIIAEQEAPPKEVNDILIDVLASKGPKIDVGAAVDKVHDSRFGSIESVGDIFKLMQYGNYGGMDYSAGRMGGDAFSTTVLPIDDLDAIFQKHDINVSVARDSDGIKIADDVLLHDLGKFLMSPPAGATPQANLFATLAFGGFALKRMAHDMGLTGIGTQPTPIQVNSLPTSSVMKTASDTFNYFPQPARNVSLWKSKRGENGDIIPNSRKRLLDYLRLLLLMQGVEPNPGPDLLTIRKVVDDNEEQSALILGNSNYQGIVIDSDFRDMIMSLSKIIQMQSPNGVNAYTEIRPGVSISYLRRSVISVVGAPATNGDAWYMSYAQAGLDYTTRVSINSGLNAIISSFMSTSPALDFSSVMSNMRTNIKQFSTSNMMTFINLRLTYLLKNSFLNAVPGPSPETSFVRPLYIAACYSMFDKFFDPYTYDNELQNIYPVDDNTVTVYSPQPLKGVSTGSNDPVMPGYTGTNNQVSYLQSVQMNCWALSMTAYIRWLQGLFTLTGVDPSDTGEEGQLVIIPITKGEEVDDVGYMTMKVLCNIRHPYCVVQRDCSMTDFDNVAGVTYFADAGQVPTAFALTVDGPKPAYTALGAVGPAMYCIFVLADAPGVDTDSSFGPPIGLYTAASAVVNVPISTPANGAVLASTNVADFGMDWLRVGGAPVAMKAQRVWNHYTSHFASEEDILGVVDLLQHAVRVKPPKIADTGSGSGTQTTQAKYVYLAANGLPPELNLGLWTEATLDTQATVVTQSMHPSGAAWAYTYGVGGNLGLLNPAMYSSQFRTALFPRKNIDVEIAMYAGWLQRPQADQPEAPLTNISSMKVHLLQYGASALVSSFDMVAELLGMDCIVWTPYSAPTQYLIDEYKNYRQLMPSLLRGEKRFKNLYWHDEWRDYDNPVNQRGWAQSGYAVGPGRIPLIKHFPTELEAVVKNGFYPTFPDPKTLRAVMNTGTRNYQIQEWSEMSGGRQVWSKSGERNLRAFAITGNPYGTDNPTNVLRLSNVNYQYFRDVGYAWTLPMYVTVDQRARFGFPAEQANANRAMPLCTIPPSTYTRFTAITPDAAVWAIINLAPRKEGSAMAIGTVYMPILDEWPEVVASFISVVGSNSWGSVQKFLGTLGSDKGKEKMSGKDMTDEKGQSFRDDGGDVVTTT
jgi:hypothetical protein